MGGHGGINILHHKSFHVYNKDNIEKVRRDEAEYEAQQAELRERAAAADAERRRELLLSRARERFGGQRELEAAEASSAGLEGTAQQQLGWQQAPAADGWEADGAALRGLAAGQADHRAALERRLAGDAQLQQPQQRQAGRRRGEREAADARQPKKQRQRRSEQAPGGAAPSLAQLAAQLDAPGSRPPAGEGQQQAHEQQLAAPAPLKRFNLFAEEEEAVAAAKRKNPEVEAERREEQRRRGDVKTQTSDARFDAQFSFAHRLHGQQAVPWYAKRGSTLPSEGDDAAAEPGRHYGTGRRAMWQWEMQAKAALAGVGPMHQPQDPQQQQGALGQAPQGLLAGVKVVRPASGADRSSSSSSSSGSESSSGSDSSSDSSSSDSSDSSGGARKRRRGGSHKRGRERKGRSSGKKGRSKDKKRRSKDRDKSRRKGKGTGGSGGRASVEELRLERLRREEAERGRQQRVLAVAAGRDPALAGKRYHGAFGFGRR